MVIIFLVIIISFKVLWEHAKLYVYNYFDSLQFLFNKKLRSIVLGTQQPCRAPCLCRQEIPAYINDEFSSPQKLALSCLLFAIHPLCESSISKIIYLYQIDCKDIWKQEKAVLGSMLKEYWKCSINLMLSNGYSQPRELVTVCLQAPVECAACKAHQISS